MSTCIANSGRAPGGLHAAARVAALALPLLMSCVARAEPVTLKLSFFTSDRTVAYAAAIKPFVDAVNKDGEGLVRIEVYASGTLGKVQRELPDLVLSGAADIAFVIPGQNPERFVDTGVIELPGLFKSVRESTMTYTRLAGSGALSGYGEFFIIGAYATSPETIHSRKPIRGLADLAGQKIRVNNATEAAALAKLGAKPSVVAFNETASAIMSGTLDGATTTAAQLFDVGIGRLTSHHYMLGTSAAPLTLLMNRKAMDALPAPAQAVIRKYSGEWAARRFVEVYEAAGKTGLEELKQDRRRTIVMPSTSDVDAAGALFTTIADEFAARSAHNAGLVRAAHAAIAEIRAGK
ncbi:MAG: TRAP transporter substrate-binding protein DctP [Pseudolabrys sp.]